MKACPGGLKAQRGRWGWGSTTRAVVGRASIQLRMRGDRKNGEGRLGEQPNEAASGLNGALAPAVHCEGESPSSHRRTHPYPVSSVSLAPRARTHRPISASYPPHGADRSGGRYGDRGLPTAFADPSKNPGHAGAVGYEPEPAPTKSTFPGVPSKRQGYRPCEGEAAGAVEVQKGEGAVEVQIPMHLGRRTARTPHREGVRAVDIAKQLRNFDDEGRHVAPTLGRGGDGLHVVLVVACVVLSSRSLGRRRTPTAPSERGIPLPSLGYMRGIIMPLYLTGMPAATRRMQSSGAAKRAALHIPMWDSGTLRRKK
ncbi:hypothetical protein C8J57DRAFT_1465034 [Mycena rebaudengoi]|nr:hypothetical protein C8J57DRAFT_1465034 [Mycena rebaudengoi]